jgi:hypothetical protein
MHHQREATDNRQILAGILLVCLSVCYATPEGSYRQQTDISRYTVGLPEHLLRISRGKLQTTDRY